MQNAANGSRETPAPSPTKADRASRGRDTREGARLDGDGSSDIEPSGRHATHGDGRLLEWIGKHYPDPDLDRLPELADEYRRRHDNGEQADMGEWS